MIILGAGREILKAVVVATLTTAGTRLVEWGIDELRKKYGTSKEDQKEGEKSEESQEV